jgi:hypothetical protein
MSKITQSLTILASMLALGLHAAPAEAQNTRSFVSATSGSDSNACTRSAPCQTFAFAITQTNAGGEVNTLDRGEYGTVTIDKSISIVSGLGEAGISVPPDGTGITINAGPHDKINLRGLIIEGAGVGNRGIQFNTGGSLNIQNSVIRNHKGNGVFFNRTLRASCSCRTRWSPIMTVKGLPYFRADRAP